jgi:hypothetical protein
MVVALLLVVISSVCAQQQYDNEKDFKVEILDGGKTVRITGYLGTKRIVRIPPQIQGLPVTEIGDNAFDAFEPGRSRNNHTFTSISIPTSVTKIGNMAFNCNPLTNFIIPEGVTHIGDSAFSANQLTNITIPNSVVYIGVGAFSTNQLTRIIISNHVGTIKERAFANNPLTSIIIPDSVTAIEKMSFLRNPLTTITVGANIAIESDPAYPTFMNGFDNFYNAQGRKAGTYTFSNGQWQAQFR